MPDGRPSGNFEINSLNGQFGPDETHIGLVAASLDLEQTRAIVELYNECGDWETTNDEWLEQRKAGRLTVEGSRRAYNAIKPRLQEAGGGLPPLSQLPTVLDACRKERDKHQVLFCYLVAEDAVVRYVLHEYIQQLQRKSVSSLDFSNEQIIAFLDQFRHTDDSPLDFSDSTKDRWGTNFRSALRSIGVIQSKQGTDGDVPNIGDTPLETAAYWSWQQLDDEWLQNPLGWRYLFQPEPFWSPQSDRLAKSTRWSTHESHGRLWYEPVEDFYANFGKTA
ncbi:BrxA family protein [Haloplanus rubicundus]|uniref:DUF1819 family protein n=1 Tax=Haloplanus rubicundus TaxID=1547898 RepID=A0A345E8A8_9EURY|nr:BrxA family protein [Haloplanus rubicundus]AXG08430.1 DUF1819 family protein [Haloplanus rubicundus]